MYGLYQRKSIAILRGETSKMTMAVLEQEAQLRSRAAELAAANLTEGYVRTYVYIYICMYCIFDWCKCMCVSIMYVCG